MSLISGSSVTGAGGVAGYQIERSLRFNSADSAYLNRTPASAGNRQTWTWSGWVKRGALGAQQTLFSAYSGSFSDTTLAVFKFNATDSLTFDAATFNYLTTSAVYRDPAAWYHVVLVFDTTNATANNRVRMYINGVEETSFSSRTNPSLNTDYGINGNWEHNIGRNTYLSQQPLNGYLTEINFIDGQALTPSDFGETDSATGVWKPKAYSGTYGTNGFYLSFSDNTSTTTLGYDDAGSNDWTTNNFSVTAGAGNDSLVDSPTAYGTDTGVGGEVRGNYCTLNPLDATLTLVNGNLDWSAPAVVERGARGTIGVSSGKWYYEYKLTSVSGTPFSLIGWASQTQNNNSTMPSDVGATGWAYYPFDQKTYHNGTASAVYGTSGSGNDIIMVALDLDNSKIYWGRNGTWFNSGNPATGTNAAYTNVSGTLFPWIQEYNQTSSINFGQRAFSYTAPSGFKALVTTNLPTPTIGATSTTQAGKYFTPYLYTADDTSPKSRTGIGFAPDFLWFKSRSTTFSHALYDQVRGTNKGLQTNTTAAENTYTLLSTFGSDGFTTTTDGTVGNILNDSTNTYVTWCWNAGGSNATNTSGTITSTVRANTTSGFSIVTYTGTGSAATIGHGLGAVPSMFIVKNRDAADAWQVYHAANTANPETDYLVLNTTAATADAADRWNDTLPTSTLFSIGNGVEVNTNTEKYVAYVFAPVAGYSAFGSYTGNAAADGPFIYTGFRPEFVMIKASSSTGDWVMQDVARSPYNVSTNYLVANASTAEQTGQLLDFVSNGFKIRVAVSSAMNGSGTTYIYMAFAENPFKYSLAR